MANFSSIVKNKTKTLREKINRINVAVRNHQRNAAAANYLDNKRKADKKFKNNVNRMRLEQLIRLFMDRDRTEPRLTPERRNYVETLIRRRQAGV